MIARVGQQSVGGRRAPDGFIDRSLPHFPFKSKFPSAKGFVAHSFFDGLSATEFFFHTMGGREGHVDTAVKTADTGYMSRRLMKALEDLAVYYDSTVRNASSCIVQFMYGDDGMNPSQMEEKKGCPLNFSRLFMKVKATCPPRGGCLETFRASLSDFLIKDLAETLKKLREALLLGEEKYAGYDLEYLENIALNISGITKKQLQVFLDTCISQYHLKRLESGTAMGAIGAQSIGEPGTQMTLKTFHFAGVASMNVTLGVPQIKEIINAAKKITTPIITAKLLSAANLTGARMIKARIEKTLLGQMAKSVKIVISLDMETIQVSQLCIDHSVKQSVLQTSKLKLNEHQVKVLNPRKLEVFPHADKAKLQFELHRLKNKLPSVVVKGITMVQRAVVNKEQQKDRKNDVKGETYEFLVEGTGLLAVMGTEGSDGRNTKNNDIMEVKQTLGIEAARVSIIDEINYTMSSHGMTIDLRHMMLLADLMTYKGDVLGITRHGVQKMKDSVLMLASFEKTTDHLFNASVNGKDDKIEGVSECIIMGIPMQIVTGMFKLRQCVEQVELNYQSEPMIS
ncbi:DNA-directed RNA polymerase III subunit RPC1 [Capsicum annuum]|nr:DNA-directed RNA polymerase III subunit RPC1 [Capsicum annuum]